jgi:hypothetical protein
MDREIQFAGTPRYMAPEQLAGDLLTPAADWYAFGLMLRQAITGEPPGPPHDPPDGSLRARGFAVPEDLDELLARLLQRAPEARPGADEILRCLGGERVAHGAAKLTAEPRRLLGRDTELRRLGEALAAVQRGALRLVRVSGPSGIGKTSLIQHFLTELARERGKDCLIVTSCCHPREAVPFNAVDGWIDGIARELPRRLDAAELLPDSAGHRALVRVFPVLGLWLHPEAPLEEPVVTEREIQAQAFLALRSILGQLARRWPLVLWMDDMQWADDDSGVLLSELVRPSGPSLALDVPPALLLLSFRDDEHAPSPRWHEPLAAAEPERGSSSVVLALGPLDELTSAELLG